MYNVDYPYSDRPPSRFSQVHTVEYCLFEFVIVSAYPLHGTVSAPEMASCLFWMGNVLFRFVSPPSLCQAPTREKGERRNGVNHFWFTKLLSWKDCFQRSPTSGDSTIEQKWYIPAKQALQCTTTAQSVTRLATEEKSVGSYPKDLFSFFLKKSLFWRFWTN